MRDGVRARSPEARAHDGEEGWGEGFVAREPHTETITLSLDYGAALSPPGSLWSTRRLDTSTSSGGQAGDAGAHHGESSTEGLQHLFRDKPSSFHESSLESRSTGPGNPHGATGAANKISSHRE